MAKSELLSAFGDEHHVRALLEDGARGLDGIFDTPKTGDGACAECGRVHDDGIAFDVAIDVEMRTVARVEDGIVFEDDDGGFDGIEGVAAVAEHTPTCAKSAEAARVAGVNGVVRDVPCPAMNDERRSHAEGAG